MRRQCVAATIALVTVTFAVPLAAQEPEGTASATLGEASLGGDSGGLPGWLVAYRPQPWTGEVGIVFGMLFPSEQHNFHGEDRPHQTVNPAGPDLGVRTGYYPTSYLGGEGEAVLAPTSTFDGFGATLWAARVHAVVQVPLWRFTPFALFGGGRMGLLSNRTGNDSDPSLHYGGGIRFGASDLVTVRLDVRDNLTQRNGGSSGPAEDGDLTHHPEILSSLAVRFYPHAAPRPTASRSPRQDRDSDGFLDAADACPDQSGVSPDGCPTADRDGDGFPDEVDRCPDERGISPDGCLSTDRDHDGVLDQDDKCPVIAGAPPDGCPVQDADEDGILDNDDQCPTKPETRNGIQDTDGCPDELPEPVQAITGVLEGLEFEPGKDSIRPQTRAKLDQAVQVLADYPEIWVRVTVHTDNAGSRDDLVELSKLRAEAVKRYLIAKGVEAIRVEARGVGPDQPMDTNDTPAGRRRNNRVVLDVVSPPKPESVPAAPVEEDDVIFETGI